MWILLYSLHHRIKAIVQPDGSHTSYKRIYCYIVSLVICPRINPDSSNNVLSNPIGVRHEVFALTHEGMRKVTCVWLLLPSITSSGGMLPLELWFQANPQGLLGRPHLIKTMFSMIIWQDRFISARALTARMRNLYGMRDGWKTINNQLFSHGYRTYRPTRKPLFEVGTGVTEPIGSMSSSLMSPDSNLTQ